MPSKPANCGERFKMTHLSFYIPLSSAAFHFTQLFLQPIQKLIPFQFGKGTASAVPSRANKIPALNQSPVTAPASSALAT
jgi:hypothetical protein